MVVLFWTFVYDFDILSDLDIPMSNYSGKESQYMVLRPGLDSDPPIGSGREPGRDKKPLHKIFNQLLPVVN